MLVDSPGGPELLRLLGLAFVVDATLLFILLLILVAVVGVGISVVDSGVSRELREAVFWARTAAASRRRDTARLTFSDDSFAILIFAKKARKFA